MKLRIKEVNIHTKTPFEAFSEKEQRERWEDKSQRWGYNLQTTHIYDGVETENAFNSIPLDSDSKILINYHEMWFREIRVNNDRPKQAWKEIQAEQSPRWRQLRTIQHPQTLGF